MTLKRLTMPRTPEDKATRDLYRIIFTDEENTRYEDVKDCIEHGAKLVGIEASYGIPLIHAIRLRCNISIIKLLVDSGGCDLTYKSIDWHYVFIWEDEEEGKGVIDEPYLYYVSIQNALVYAYTIAIGCSINNQVVDELFKQGYIRRIIYEKETPEPINQWLCDYVKQCCELVGLDFETIQTARYKLLPDLQSVKDLHKIPKNKHPYNWHVKRDVTNIEDGIEDSSEDESDSEWESDSL